MLLKEKISLWRNRFFGRQDSFGSKVTYFNKKENKMVTHYVAEFTEQFRDTESRKGVTLENTPVAEYFVPLQDNHVEGHLKGFKELLVYVLQTDGTTKFAALDFDTKHTFEDVMKIYDMVAIAHQFPCYIAKSTSKGHHLYMFFDDFIEAKYVTSYIAHVYEELGFLEDYRNGSKPIPETFPKTIAVPDALSTGYGIKPPMQGKGMGRDMNCWVDAENGMDIPIGDSGNSDKQWDYFADTEKISVGDFKEFLEKSRIQVEEIRISEKRGVVPQDRRRTMEYKPPNDGDIHRVIQGCPAMKAFWEGPEADFKHNARVALVSWAMQTKNGLEVLQERWKGSDKAEKQIQYAIDNVQRPWSCKAMQDHECCVVGRDPKFATGNHVNGKGEKLRDHCFRKSAPKETIHGKLVSNPRNLSESEWPDPSPVRLRVELKRVTVNRLKEEIDELSKDDPELGNKVTDVYSKMLHLKDKKKRTEVENYLKSKKLAKVKELKEIAKEAKEQRKIESEREVEESGRSRPLNGYNYAIGEDGGYSLLDYDSEGGVVEKPICNFQIILSREVHDYTSINEPTITFHGKLLIGKNEKVYEVTTSEWASNVQLAQSIMYHGAMSAVVPTYNLDHMRAAVHLFGIEDMSVEKSFKDYGFDNHLKPELFRSTNFTVTSTEITPDTKSLNFSQMEFAKNLSLAEISPSDIKATIAVLFNDFLKLQDYKITITALAHSVQAVIQNSFLPISESPILWLQGLTGSGKTTIAKFVQQLHGKFDTLVTINSTMRSIEQYSYYFKDALLVIDDYKAGFHGNNLVPVLQSLYDRSSRGKMNKDGNLASVVNNRSLLMFTAEDCPQAEASVISRLIILESPHISVDSEETEHSFNRVSKYQDKFPSITAKFIQYMLVNYPDPKVIKNRFEDYLLSLKNPIRGSQNSHRIANNLAANLYTWNLFLDFIDEKKIINKDIISDLREYHRININKIRDRMVSLCSEEQASYVFLSAVRSLIDSGKCRLKNHQEHDASSNSIIIGKLDIKNKLVYLNIKASMAEVKPFLERSGSAFSHTSNSIGKQFENDGLIRKSYPKRNTVQLGGDYAWCLKSDFLFNNQDEEKNKKEDCSIINMATF
jgi:hypothetical protein